MAARPGDKGKGGSAGGEPKPHHLLASDPAHQGKRIFHVKLNKEVLQELQFGSGEAVFTLGKGDRSILKLGNNKWTLQTPSTEEEKRILECVRTSNGVCYRLGMSERLVLQRERGLKESEKEELKRVNAEEQQRKKQGAAIKHDPCSSAGKKRKIVDVVGKAEQSSSSRASPTIVAKVDVDKEEVHKRVMHALGIADIDHDELKRRCLKKEEEITGKVTFKDICSEVANYVSVPSGEKKWRLKLEYLKKLDVDGWSEYSDNDRRLIRARLSILAPTTIAANSEDEVKELKSRYKEKYAKYEETNMKLNEWQRQFETLAADLSKSKDKSKQALRKEITEKFNSLKVAIMETHTTFLLLHDELLAIKEAIRNFSASNGAKAPA
mmetsp:Transcript_12940/g.29761  ORF Transcript_12940/g.29761 Transcript_12940/m.29761 type:complete len:381 (-) Transcript_12940:64-1206(-)